MLIELLKESVALRDVLLHDGFKNTLFSQLCDLVNAAEDRSVTGVLERDQSSEEYQHLAQGLNLFLAQAEMLLAWSDDQGRSYVNALSTSHFNPEEPPNNEHVVNLPPPAIEDTLASSDQQQKRCH
jgi:hypothetical protein